MLYSIMYGIGIHLPLWHMLRMINKTAMVCNGMTYKCWVMSSVPQGVMHSDIICRV